MDLGAPRVGVTRGSSPPRSVPLPDSPQTKTTFLAARSALFSFTGLPLIPRILLFGSSPFAAPNSRSPPKFDHSLTFTLLLKNTGATLLHGRPSLHPNLDAPSPPIRRSAPRLPVTPHYPPPAAACLSAAPLFSCSYKSLFPQALYFHIHPNPPGVWGYKPPISLPTLCLSGKSIAFMLLQPLCRLFALFSAFASFVFNRLQPLSTKHPGWGGYHRSSFLGDAGFTG